MQGCHIFAIHSFVTSRWIRPHKKSSLKVYLNIEDKKWNVCGNKYYCDTYVVQNKSSRMGSLVWIDE